MEKSHASIGSHLRDPYVIGPVLLIAALFLFKSRTLDLPYYWDEAWVYAPAVKAMSDHGPSLMPTAIPPELSRGHPVLFHALAATWSLVFGSTRWSLHAFQLMLSAVVLVLTYLLAKRTASPQAALFATGLVAVNELFLAQSAILLPEMLLTLFVLGSLLAFVHRNAAWFIALASAALLTKESALVLVCAAAAWQTIVALSAPSGAERRMELRWLLISVTPLLPAALFFLVQWARLGWVLYPEHIGMITWDARDIIYKAKTIYTRIFEEQGTIVLTYAACYGGPLLWKAMPRWRGAITVLLFVAALKILWGRWPVPFMPTIGAVLVCFGGALLLFFLPAQRLSSERGRALGLFYVFVLGYWAFSALNFYTDRYLLCMVPVIAVGGLTLLWRAFEERWSWAFPLVAGTAVLVPAYLIGRDGKVGDTKLSYARAVIAERELVHYCERKGYHHRQFHASFMDRYYMNDTTLGYLERGSTFPFIADTLAPSTTLAIVSSTSPAEERDRLERMGFTTEVRFGDEVAWCELLSRAPQGTSAHP